jgi:hypothetical protein
MNAACSSLLVIHCSCRHHPPGSKVLWGAQVQHLGNVVELQVQLWQAWTGVVNFYYGSSAGSKAKTDALTAKELQK